MCRTQHNFRRQQTHLFSTSASAAYLDSISYKPPSVEDGLLGATSKYLDALSSVSNQLQTSAGYYQYYSQTYNPNNNEGTVPSASGATTGQVQASVEAASTAANHVGSSLSEDQLVNEVVQRVTQEFSSTLEAFAGEKIDSFMDSASTLLADSTQAYIWDIEEAAEKGRKGSGAVKAAAQKLNTNTPNDETLRELTSKLDNTFRSFRENLSSSTHSATAGVAGALRRETSQPNAAIEAAKRQESILGLKQKVETGALTPEAISTNAKEAVDIASNVATKAITELESTAPLSTSAAGLGKTASATTSAFSKSLSETASNVDAAIGGVTSKASSAFGSIITNTNQGIEQALSSVAKTTTAATTSIDAATSSAMGSIGAVGSSISSGASAAASSVSNSFGAVGASAKAAGASLTNGASSAATGVQTSVGALGSTAKAAIVTAQPGMSATGGKISAVALSASQGFGMPGNAYAGGGDVAGLIEMTVATIVSIPRAILDAYMFENNPNGMNELKDGIMNELTDGIAESLANDILVPLSEPIRSVAQGAAAASPLDNAQAVLQSLEMVLALVVGIPRAALEGLTGLTIGEIQVELAHADIQALAEQLAGFASAVSSVLVSLLQVIAKAISVIVTQTGLGDAIASGQEELVSQLSRFVVEDLLPAILDGLLFILQQFAMLLIEGGSAVFTAM